MDSLYKNLLKDVEKLVQSGQFEAAHKKINQYREDDNEAVLNSARFLLFSKEKNNPFYDPQKATHALDRACENGDTWAIANKGYLLMKGALYQKNVEEADDLFTSISEKSPFAKYQLAVINTQEYSEEMRTKEAIQEARGYLLELIESQRCDPIIKEKSKVKWIELTLEDDEISNKEASRIWEIITSMKNPNGDKVRVLTSKFLLKLTEQQIDKTYALERHPEGIVEKERFNLSYNQALKSLEQLKSCL